MSDYEMQYIMDGSGNYYRLNGNDELVVAECKEEATVFSSVDANQRIGDGKKAKFYRTTPVGVQNIIPISDKESVNEQSNVQTKFEYNIEDIDWMDYMNLFCYLANVSKNYQEELRKKHSVVEREICDLLHYIELYDLTDNERMHAIDLIKEARQRRRAIKDDMTRVELFLRSIGTSANVAKAKECIKELGKLDTRKYHPRELKELFEGMNNKLTEREVHREGPIQYKVITGGVTNVDYIRRDTIFDGQHNDWLKMAQEQKDFFENIQQYMVNLELDLDELYQSIEHILSELENTNYNVAQSYKVYKELRELRICQSEKTEELEFLRRMTECFDCMAMVDAYQYVLDFEFSELKERISYE